jgi:hypothetical protein
VACFRKPPLHSFTVPIFQMESEDPYLKGGMELEYSTHLQMARLASYTSVSLSFHTRMTVRCVYHLDFQRAGLTNVLSTKRIAYVSYRAPANILQVLKCLVDNRWKTCSINSPSAMLFSCKPLQQLRINCTDKRRQGQFLKGVDPG